MKILKRVLLGFVAVVILIGAAYLVTSLVMFRPYCDGKRIPIRYLIPEGFRGRVIGYYGVADAPPLSMESGYLVVRISNDGTWQTSSPFQVGCGDPDEFVFLNSKGERKPIPPEKSWELTGEFSNGTSSHRFAGQIEHFFVGDEKTRKAMKDTPSTYAA